MNKRDRDTRFSGLKRIGCIACIMEGKGRFCGELEVHHLNKWSLKGHARRGDEYTICLGVWHHKGVSKPGMSVDAMTKEFGPSWYHDKEQFVLAYKGDDFMLELSNIKLGNLEWAVA